MAVVLALAVLLLHTLAFPSIPPPHAVSSPATLSPDDTIAVQSAANAIEANEASAMRSAVTEVEVDEPEVHLVRDIASMQFR